MAIGAASCFSVLPNEGGKEELQIRSGGGTVPGAEPLMGEQVDAGTELLCG